MGSLLTKSLSIDPCFVIHHAAFQSHPECRSTEGLKVAPSKSLRDPSLSWSCASWYWVPTSSARPHREFPVNPSQPW
jgi:hypothetical protein